MLVLSGAPAAFAHDFWIEPSTFRPTPGSTLEARLLVGAGFRGEPLPRNDRLVSRFVLAGPSGTVPLQGEAGAEPAGRVRISGRGILSIGYESSFSVADLDPATLARYVEEEGLEPFFHGSIEKPLRDHFARCAKALVRAGAPRAADPGWNRLLGLPLELVPDASPWSMGKDWTLPVRVLLGGKPLANALVAAIERSSPAATRVAARTNGEGNARLKLAGPGIWLVKSVYIRPRSGTEDEWESFWASLTFEIDGRDATEGKK